MDKATTYLHLIIECGFRISIWLFYLWLDERSPYVRHIDEDELWYYRYPSKDITFTWFWLHIIMIATPGTIYFLQYVMNKDEKSTVPSIVSSIYGLTLAYCWNGLYTAALKMTVGRPRPNFYLRCFPEGYGTDIDNCDGEYMGQMEGRKSFPSAHTSFAFTCMVYMVLHMYTILDLRRPRFLKGIIISGMFTMILSATLIAVSRAADYHHHFSDVIAGAMLGSIIAYITHSLYCIRDSALEENIRKIMKIEK